mgnify:CR=1 FL=1|jgi:opacity protein-like surface antigen
MDNSKYDDLDKLFQSRLKDENVVKEDWNKPPRAVFDGALASLSNDRNKKRKRFLIWFLGAIIGTGILLISLHTCQRLQNLETTISTLQTEQQEYNNQTNQAKLQNNIAAIPSDEQDKPSNNLEASKMIDPPVIHSDSKGAATHGLYNQTSSYLVKQEQTTNEKEPEQIIEQSTIEVQKDNVMIQSPMLVQRKYSIVYDHAIPKIHNVVTASVKRSSDGFVPGIFLYALAGMNASTIRMTNTEGADFSLTGYERYYADLFAGAGLAYEFNDKWAIDLQATYNRMHVKSTFEDDILYDESKEIIDDQGNIHFDSDYDIFTVMGRQSGYLSLVVDKDQIDDQEKMTNLTTIDNSFRTVGLSLGSLYTPVSKERFTFSIGAGVQYNYIIQLEEQMETSISYNSALLFQESLQVKPKENTNRNFWSLYGNIRLGYELSDHFGIKLDIASAHSLSSIRKTSGPADSKTYINNLRTALMFYYAF